MEAAPPTIFFPQIPGSPGHVDPEFSSELEAARAVGFGVEFYEHESAERLRSDEAIATVRPPNSPTNALLRGWMLPGAAFEALHGAISARGFSLLTSPTAYCQAHYLPLAYPLIEGLTARSKWFEGNSADEAWELYQGFMDRDAIIKDWVKSAKRRWKDACYIPAGTSEERFREMFEIFLHERGKLFNRGVVLREFLPLMRRGSDILGLPIVEETRLYFFKGNLLVRPEGRSPSPMDEIDRWTKIARKFESPFMTVDVACLDDGSWTIVEVGDGQVSGLPMGLDPMRFFASLWNAMS